MSNKNLNYLEKQATARFKRDSSSSGLTDRERAENNYKLFLNVNTVERMKYMFKAEEGHLFYKNEQLSLKEKEMLRRAHMPSYIINMTTPTIDVMKYFVTSNSPRWSVSGRDGTDSDFAERHRALMEYCYSQSNGDDITARVVLHCFTKGKSYFNLHVDSNLDRGKGEVVFDWLPTENVIVDPSSTDPFARDANYIIVAKNIATETLINKYPDLAEEIKNAEPSSIQTVYEEDSDKERQSKTSYDSIEGDIKNNTSYFEVYRKEMIKFYDVVLRQSLSPEESAGIKENAKVMLEEYILEMEVQYEETVAELEKRLNDEENPIIQSRYELEVRKAGKEKIQKIKDKEETLYSEVRNALFPINHYQITEKEFRALEKNPITSEEILSYTTYLEARVNVTISCAKDILLDYKDLPYKYIPIVQLPYLHDGTPYPLSAVEPLKGKQREINKSHQIMLFNASQSTNNAWISEEGMIRDEKKFKKELRTPNGIAKYVGTETGNAPRQVPVTPLQNAFYTITQEGRSDFEYLSGIGQHTMGIVSNGDEPYKLAMARDEFSTRRLRAWIQGVFEPCLLHLAKVFTMVAQSAYSGHKIFRITTPGAENKNTEETLYEINVPIWDEQGNMQGKMFDYQKATFDLRFTANSTMPSNKEAKEEKLFAMVKEGIVDDIYYRNEIDLPNREALEERFSQQSQMKAELENKDEKIKSLKGDIETLRRQLLQSDLSLEQIEAGLEINKSVLKTQAQQQTLRDRNELNVKEAKIDVKSAVKNFIANLLYKSKKAEIDLERKKSKSDSKSKKDEKSSKK